MFISLVVTLVLSGCKNQPGVDRSFVTKRQHTKGYYWKGFKKKAIDPDDLTANRERIKPMPLIGFHELVFDENARKIETALIYNGENANIIKSEYFAFQKNTATTYQQSAKPPKSHSSPKPSSILVLPAISGHLLSLQKAEIDNGLMSFKDFSDKFPLEYGYDREDPLEKRGLSIDNNAINTFAFRSMLGTGVIGTSFVISATALTALLILLGFLLSYVAIAGRRKKGLTSTKLSSLSTAGLVLGGVVVASSGLAILTALLT